LDFLQLEKVQERLFNYNFATPGTIGNQSDAQSRANILNINNTDDPITTDLPKGTWYRHGRDIEFEKAGDPKVKFKLGPHRAELYQREIIRNTGFTLPLR